MLILFLLPLIVVCVLREWRLNLIKAIRLQRAPSRLAKMDYG
jgi:hypothetical protein